MPRPLVRARILAYLEQCDETIGTSAVADAIGIGHHVARVAMNKMAKLGLIHVTGTIVVRGGRLNLYRIGSATEPIMAPATDKMAELLEPWYRAAKAWQEVRT